MKDIFTEYPDLVNTKQLSKMLQIGVVLTYKLIKSGEIKSIKIGREYKIRKCDIIDYIDGK